MAQTDNGVARGSRSTSDDHSTGATKGVAPTVTKSATVGNVVVSASARLGGCQVRFPGGGYTTTDGGQ